jgi:hypothetical protein
MVDISDDAGNVVADPEQKISRLPMLSAVGNGSLPVEQHRNRVSARLCMHELVEAQMA